MTTLTDSPSFRLELPLEVPREMVAEVESKLRHCSNELTEARIDLDARSVVICRLRGERDDVPIELSETIKRVVQHTVDGLAVRQTDLLVDRTHVPMVSGQDPMDWLEARGQVHQLDRGQYALGPLVTGLMDYFDRRFCGIFEEFQASERRFPSMIPTRTLQRCDYFSSFPHSINFIHHLHEDVDRIDAFAKRTKADGFAAPQADELACCEHVMSPAGCFHWYSQLADQQLGQDGADVATAVGKCFRYEAGNLKGLERLWDFTMRECIFVGPSDKVLARRETSIERLTAFLDELGFNYTIELATDPFFISDYKSKSMFQSAFKLKYEIQLTLPYTDGSVAAGSFNYHQSFFGQSFNITLPDGSPAHTGCTAMGLERWAMAFCCQFGVHPKNWPTAVANAVADRLPAN